MVARTHEQTVNSAFGEVLRGLRRPGAWDVLAETPGVLAGGGRIDVLVLEAAGWPVAIEAELEHRAGAETEAAARLGRTTTRGAHPIETAVALVYPPALRRLDGEVLRDAIRATGGLEYALYSRTADGGPPERLPASGWLRGSVRDLAMLAHRAATPAGRVDALAGALERGVEEAAEGLIRRHRYGSARGTALALVLGQDDDRQGQTRRMAMTVIANALIFHAALAEADFEVDAANGARRPVRPAAAFIGRGDAFDRPALLAEWGAILERNYWPIFASAKALLDPVREDGLPTATAQAVLAPLWRTARELVAGGVTRSHDLTGVVFQRLIADRKFLATYYTRPAAAALLAGLALPAARAPGGADWGDGDTLASLQIGDFACGTGTLLSAAYSRLSLLHELHGGDPKALHAPMMKHGLVGLDVLNIAVHLTAAMLAGAHPDTPFDGECLLTMPYGAQPGDEVRAGSLDLLAEHAQARLIGQAAATTAGGRRPEDVDDLVNRVGHDHFDLVIMNPPFTRPTNHEASHANVPFPAYAAFNNTRAEQEAMSAKVKTLTGDAPSNDYAGLASHFAELAHRKVQAGGALALVLPLSALSGGSWNGVRQQWRDHYGNTVVVTIAQTGTHDRSFSADTGMAECLVATVYNTANSEQRTANSEQRTANSEQRTANSEQRTANSEQRTANSEQRTANSEQRTANSEQRTANSEQRTREPYSPSSIGNHPLSSAASSSPPQSGVPSMAARCGGSRTARSAERRSCSARSTVANCSTARSRRTGRGRWPESRIWRWHRSRTKWSAACSRRSRQNLSQCRCPSLSSETRRVSALSIG